MTSQSDFVDGFAPKGPHKTAGGSAPGLVVSPEEPIPQGGIEPTGHVKWVRPLRGRHEAEDASVPGAMPPASFFIPFGDDRKGVTPEESGDEGPALLFPAPYPLLPSS